MDGHKKQADPKPVSLAVQAYRRDQLLREVQKAGEDGFSLSPETRSFLEREIGEFMKTIKPKTPDAEEGKAPERLTFPNIVYCLRLGLVIQAHCPPASHPPCKQASRSEQ